MGVSASNFKRKASLARLSEFIKASYTKLKVLPSPFLVNRAAPVSVSLAFGPHSYTSTVNATVGGWSSGSTLCFTATLFPEVLNAKQGNSMYHFSSLWYARITKLYQHSERAEVRTWPCYEYFAVIKNRNSSFPKTER